MFDFPWVTPAALALCLAVTTPARAAPTPQPNDYDAADPQRDALTYLHAAANTLLVNCLIWQFDWLEGAETIYFVTGKDIANNFRHGFTFDTDGLSPNFFGHAYGGALHFGAARSTGLGFWETAPFVVAGSVVFEYFSENQYPATNDLIVTSFAGVALGEVLHRMSSLTLDDSTSGFGRFVRELRGTAIDPGRGMTRLFTGQTWTHGAPPTPKPARIAAHVGLDQIQAGTVTDGASFNPSLLIAVDAEYGDLLPAASSSAGTIAAYDFFDFRAAALLVGEQTSGIEYSSLALLHGWSSDMSSAGGPFRDNNVVGFFQSIDYQGSNRTKFAALSAGVGDLVVLRGGPSKRLRLSLDVGWTPLAGMSSAVTPYVGTTFERDYNFSTGASVGLGLRWDVGRLGQLGLRTRQYATAVIDGIHGEELFGYAHAWYEVDLVRDRVGLGVSPKLIHEAGRYTRDRSFQATQLSTQLYLSMRL